MLRNFCLFRENKKYEKKIISHKFKKSIVLIILVKNYFIIKKKLKNIFKFEIKFKQKLYTKLRIKTHLILGDLK